MLSVLYFWLGLGPGLALVTAGLGLEAKIMASASMMWPWPRPHALTASLTSLPVAPPDFSVFKPTFESEVSKILFNSPNKQCDSDPIPTWLLKECASVIIPTITDVVNLSPSSGHFYPVFKQSIVSPLLKKSTLDNEQLSNYRPISNLSLISKIIERVVKSRRIRGVSRNALYKTYFTYFTLLVTSFLTICWILTSLPNDGTIPRKRLSYTSTTTSSVLLIHKNFLVSVSLTSLLPLIP